MKFGLWVAFTQISEALLKKHPDWITTPGARIDPHRPFPFPNAHPVPGEPGGSCLDPAGIGPDCYRLRN